MTHWPDALRQALAAGHRAVVVTIAAVQGSAPREAGAAMVVTADSVSGSIGGGNLEFEAIDRARQRLGRIGDAGCGSELQRWVLGTELGQCCGGVVDLHLQWLSPPQPDWLTRLLADWAAGRPLILVSRCGGVTDQSAVVTARGVDGPDPDDPLLAEAVVAAWQRLNSPCLAAGLLWGADGSSGQEKFLLRPLLEGDFRVLLFGAGHVGRALVRVLEPLASRIHWSDSREQEFPEHLPAQVQPYLGDPFELIAQAPAGAYFLVMTHSHALDLALADSILQREDFSYFGLIGSRSKRNRFRRHLREEGIADRQIERMTCPIGVAGIRDKAPDAIAVAVAAELLQVRDAVKGDATLFVPKWVASPLTASPFTAL